MGRVRGTAVVVDSHAVLLRGGSGTGKSDLALRLIDGGAKLVADDYTEVTKHEGRIMATPPDELMGLLEVRGLGVIRLPWEAPAPLVAVFELVEPDQVERHPEPEVETLEGVDLPRFRVAPFEAAAAAKVRLAVRLATGGIMRVP